MKKYIAIASLLCIAAAAMTAQRTTRRNLRPQRESAVALEEPADSRLDTLVSFAPHTVDINGYDKPLRSRRETFFVTNNGADSLARIAFTIDYYDTKNRQLHSASHNVAVTVPPSQTRQVYVRSWDTQFSFFYLRSAVPQRLEQATPYDVRITVDTLFVR